MTKQDLIEKQLRARGIKDPRVLEAFEKVDRAAFVPESYKDRAYEDAPLPIGLGQTISQPYIVAFITEAAEVQAQDRVLEIGVGSGYQAAILAELAKEVFGVERHESFVLEARERLQSLGYKNIQIKHGDGSKGWEENAPYDVIIVSAAAFEIPKALVDQLKEGGRLIIPVGEAYGVQNLMKIRKEKDGLSKTELSPVRFVPLVSSD